ncbi:hypothetical protein PLICRDRAFT_108635 [Plicaturopsis crispa FD-325 SS-3]|nr:hypothetical protein PLICRDRAFT_108635 [Plicaturopsis crispa FD-325 SS-3]
MPRTEEQKSSRESYPAEGYRTNVFLRSPGACSRCKSLKVKCESSSDTDPCKRCLNGGHECITPGRKKRRVPPKREHLLKEIREQASEIQRLMALLEETKAPSPSSSGDADLHSPTLGSYDSKPEVRDWLAEARASIDAFGGLIGAGGAGMTKSLLVDEDPEDSESDPDAYEEAVEDLYGEGSGVDESPRSEDRARSTSKERDPAPKRSSGDKLATIPSGASPFGLMADMALKKSRRRRSSVGSNADDVGLANDNFFRPSPGPDPARTASNGSHQEPQVPHILSRGIITTKEAEKLFSIYFDYMNLSVSLLDPVIYTAQNTCWRNPFLFTVICAIASRFYTERPELYHQIMKYAQLAAGTALISGQKSVDVCHAYILMCLYPVPARRWEEDRSWIYLGLAIRIAIDLNLHHPNTATPLNEHHAREMLNRSRLWLNCFNLDRSTGSQYGKTPIIPSTDYVANNSVSWWCSSAYNLSNFDVHTCAYNSELRVMGAFLQKIYNDPKHPTGLNKEADFEKIAIETDDDLVSLGDRWFKCLEQGDTTNPQFCFRTGLLRLAYSYARLLALSFGFQHAFGKNNTDENPFLLRCYRAASDVVNTILNDVARPSQRVYLRHGPEAQSVFVTFACAFLVKLLQPKFASYLSREQREEIRSLVQQVIDLLGSPDIAIDDRHGPKLYSRFLKGLLATPMARVDSQSPSDLKTRQPSLPRQSSSETSIESITGSSVYVTSPGEDAPLSPQPTSATSMAFDQFAPLLDGAESLAPTGRRASLDTQPMLNMDATDLFRPPLPFDDELLQSMQQLSNHAWHDTAIPGELKSCQG